MVVVSAEDLRKRFNSTVQPRIDSGLYKVNPVTETKPGPKYDGVLPPGTKSTYFHVVDQNGNMVAHAHAFVLPDGSYAFSGLLDPKRIRVGKVTHCLKMTW